MGMASSDDDRKIILERDLRDKVKRLHPEYEFETHGMSEDMKAIHDADLMDRHLGRGAYAPKKVKT